MWLYGNVAMWLCSYAATPKDTKKTMKDTIFTEGHFFDFKGHYFETKDTKKHETEHLISRK